MLDHGPYFSHYLLCYFCFLIVIPLPHLTSRMDMNSQQAERAFQIDRHHLNDRLLGSCWVIWQSGKVKCSQKRGTMNTKSFRIFRPILRLLFFVGAYFSSDLDMQMRWNKLREGKSRVRKIALQKTSPKVSCKTRFSPFVKHKILPLSFSEGEVPFRNIYS